MSPFDVVIIGSGPAGLAAYAAASLNGAKVLLCERLSCLSRKLLASGGGKCNLTNVLSDEVFMARFGRNGRFMSHALKCGGRDKVIDFMQNHGVPLKVVDSVFYFPKSERAEDVRNAYLKVARERGGEDRVECEVNSITVQNGMFHLNGGAIVSRRLILAAGGNAMSALGGTRSGLDLAESLGHSIVSPLPAMAPVILRERLFDALAGVSLPDAEISFKTRDAVHRERGNLLFTHDGFSGPAALNVSAPLYRAFERNSDVELIFSPVAGRTLRQWSDFFQTQRLENPKKHIQNVLSFDMPKALAAVLCDASGIGDRPMAEVKNRDIESLAKNLSGMKLHVGRICPMDRAMAMSGGVSLKEVDPKTMESRIVPGLYFAGEILDLAAPCGGFFIQFALASGTLAGMQSAIQ